MNLNSLLLYTCTDPVTYWQCLLIASTRKSVGSEAIRMFKCSWHIRTKASILPTYKRVAPEFNESSFYLSGEVGSVDITAVITTTTTTAI